MVNPVVAGSLVLFMFIEIMETINLWKSIQESFQVKWLLKFLSMSELKNFIFKNLKVNNNLEASSSNNMKWIGFYRLIKLRFCMGQNAGYFN